ncbi:MAG: LysE family transporter [Chitinophagaceae bacterium]|nr:LysE family transporter [Chitinophagaceae bacterium]
MVSALLTGLAFGLVMSVSVGPAIFAIIKYSITYGWRAGLSFVFGISLSDTLYVALANMASGFLSELLDYKTQIGYVGSLIFIVLGVYGFFKKIKVTRHRGDMATVSSGQYYKIFASGFLMNTFNPGVILTWITSVAAIATMGSGYRFVFFGSCLGLILSFDLLKVFLAQLIRRKLTPRNIVYLNRISALFLFGIGLFIFLAIFLQIKIGHNL